MRLIGSSNEAVIQVDLSKPFAYTKLELDWGSKTTISFHTIKVNEDISDRHFEFPDIDGLRKQLPVQELSDTHGLDEHEMTWRAWQIRRAIKRPELREKMDKTDRDQVEKNDKALSKLLREKVVIEIP